MQDSGFQVLSEGFDAQVSDIASMLLIQRPGHVMKIPAEFSTKGHIE